MHATEGSGYGNLPSSSREVQGWTAAALVLALFSRPPDACNLLSVRHLGSLLPRERSASL
jgi:hypothetical protein